MIIFSCFILNNLNNSDEYDFFSCHLQTIFESHYLPDSFYFFIVLQSESFDFAIDVIYQVNIEKKTDNGSSFPVPFLIQFLK